MKDGHKISDPDKFTYTGFVLRDSVRIALAYAALNSIDVREADIKNAYLQAPLSDKYYIICGGEFCIEHIGKISLICQELYGDKSIGANFWKHIRSCMKHLGFMSCKAKPDLWILEEIEDDGLDYWEYFLLYASNALCVSVTNILSSFSATISPLPTSSVFPLPSVLSDLL